MPREHQYYVYLLTNRNDKVMYIGMTNNLRQRVYQHKKKLVPGFTQKYNVDKLVYYEITNDVRAAIAREKEIKKWRREKKEQPRDRRQSRVEGPERGMVLDLSLPSR